MVTVVILWLMLLGLEVVSGNDRGYDEKQRDVFDGEIVDHKRSELDDLKTQMHLVADKLVDALETLKQSEVANARRINTLESQVETLQSSVGSVRRCRLCFREIEGSSQCQRSRSSCSGWSSSPSWTSPFRDDTDGRGGGCTYQWRIECI